MCRPCTTESTSYAAKTPSSTSPPSAARPSPPAEPDPGYSDGPPAGPSSAPVCVRKIGAAEPRPAGSGRADAFGGGKNPGSLVPGGGTPKNRRPFCRYGRAMSRVVPVGTIVGVVLSWALALAAMVITIIQATAVQDCDWSADIPRRILGATLLALAVVVYALTAKWRAVVTWHAWSCTELPSRHLRSSRSAG